MYVYAKTVRLRKYDEKAVLIIVRRPGWKACGFAV